MAKHKFEIRTDGDECEEVWLNGKRLMSTNHDEHGWDGMQAVRDCIEAIATELGASFKTGVPMEDDD